MKILHIQFFFLLFVVLLSGCDTSLKDPVVAKFGKHHITLQEFRIAYLKVLKQPDKFDSPKLRAAFLDEMINRTLLADQARQQGMDQDERFRLKVDAYKAKCLRDEHYRQMIAPHIHVNEPLLREIYRYTKEQRHIRHLFFPRKAQADAAAEQLAQGIPFEQIAAATFANSELAENGGNLGWVHWDQLDYEMGMAAFRQQPGTYSSPVRSSHGYHIINVVDTRSNPLVDESDYRIHREKTKLLVENKIGEMQALDYIRPIMDKADIKICPQELQQVSQAMKRWMQTQKGDSLSMKADSTDVPDMENAAPDLWAVRDRPLFYVDGQSVTIGQFISNLPYLPEAIVKKSMRTALDYSIRDFLVTADATKHGLSRSKRFQIKSGLFADYLLQIKLRKQIIARITVSESELKARFDELIAGKQTSRRYSDFRDELQRIVQREKRTTAVPEYIQQLRADVSIQKDMQPIHAYYDGIGK